MAKSQKTVEKQICPHCNKPLAASTIKAHMKAAESVGMIGEGAKQVYSPGLETLKNVDLSPLLQNSPIIQQILERINRLESSINRVGVGVQKRTTSHMEQGIFDEIILSIYREVRTRPRQAVSIDQIWSRFRSRSPDVDVADFCQYLLNSASTSFHLEDGTSNLQVKDPVTGRVFGYVIGN
jgi:hypothetical protein